MYLFTRAQFLEGRAHARLISGPLGLSPRFDTNQGLENLRDDNKEEQPHLQGSSPGWERAWAALWALCPAVWSTGCTARQACALPLT